MHPMIRDTLLIALSLSREKVSRDICVPNTHISKILATAGAVRFGKFEAS